MELLADGYKEKEEFFKGEKRSSGHLIFAMNKSCNNFWRKMQNCILRTIGSYYLLPLSTPIMMVARNPLAYVASEYRGYQMPLPYDSSRLVQVLFSGNVHAAVILNLNDHHRNPRMPRPNRIGTAQHESQ